jgi:hypothetical protein
MANIFVQVLDKYGCTHLINCITADNASNNKKMGKRLKEMSYTEKRFEFVAKEELNVDNIVTKFEIIEEETETSENENENESESNSSDDNENNNKLNAGAPIQKLKLACKLIKGIPAKVWWKDLLY